MRGSSPLARGTPDVVPAGAGGHRFIPARAGNTVGMFARQTGKTGSSPLARGTRTRAASPWRRARFIPARAGNTLRQPRPFAQPSVHPRSRGEHCPTSPDGSSPNGSSPLARGTHQERRHERHDPRFIPARAGNTRPARTARTATRVHPRSRGEHAGEIIEFGAEDGSSPLARGTRVVEPHVNPDGRFIPARAGNT